jgi:hypothetical protein
MEQRTPITAAYEQATRAAIELRRGRPLTLAERNIEIAQLNRDLNDGKHALRRAIEREQRRAVRRWVRSGFLGQPRIRVTPEMRGLLAELHDKGRRHGERELERAGYSNRRYASRRRPKLTAAAAKLQQLLYPLNARLERAALGLDLGGLAQERIVGALAQVPGALDVAGRMVSGAMYGGLGEAFDRASEQVDAQPEPGQGGGNGWEYTAVMDDATCDPCASAEGTTYETWDEAQDDLPDGGPNPECDGEERCRCRLAPVPL